MTSNVMRHRWVLASGNFFFKIRNALFPILFVLIILLTRPALFMNNPQLDRIVMAIGAVLALSGQAFRLLVIGFAYIKRGGKDRQVFARNLVVAGLYAHSRNPMYVGNFLIACGVLLFYGSAWTSALMIPFFAYVYLAITAAEENYLLGKFGAEYQDYMKRVHRFWPDFRGLGESLRGYPYRWKTVLSKEYGTLFATLAGLVAIAMWRKYCIYGWAAQKSSIIALSYLLIPLAAFYITVRVLKFSGKLREAKPADA